MNDYLNPDLKPLVEKVYNEGIRKAEEEAGKIIAEAKRQSSELLKETIEHIAKMEAQSKGQMNRIRKNLNSELKTVSQLAVSSVKNELSAVISNKITKQGISAALSEKEFLQKIIFMVLQKWNPADTNLQFELLLNKDDEAQLKDLFQQRIKNELATELEIVIENKIKSGFRIGVKNENYYVSFTDEVFESFFKGYLRKKTIEWIYENKETNHE